MLKSYVSTDKGIEMATNPKMAITHLMERNPSQIKFQYDVY